MVDTIVILQFQIIWTADRRRSWISFSSVVPWRTTDKCSRSNSANSAGIISRKSKATFTCRIRRAWFDQNNLTSSRMFSSQSVERWSDSWCTGRPTQLILKTFLSKNICLASALMRRPTSNKASLCWPNLSRKSLTPSPISSAKPFGSALAPTLDTAILHCTTSSRKSRSSAVSSFTESFQHPRKGEGIYREAIKLDHYSQGDVKGTISSS